MSGTGGSGARARGSSAGRAHGGQAGSCPSSRRVSNRDAASGRSSSCSTTASWRPRAAQCATASLATQARVRTGSRRSGRYGIGGATRGSAARCSRSRSERTRDPSCRFAARRTPPPVDGRSGYYAAGPRAKGCGFMTPLRSVTARPFARPRDVRDGSGQGPIAELCAKACRSRQPARV